MTVRVYHDAKDGGGESVGYVTARLAPVNDYPNRYIAPPADEKAQVNSFLADWLDYACVVGTCNGACGLDIGVGQKLIPPTF